MYIFILRPMSLLVFYSYSAAAPRGTRKWSPESMYKTVCNLEFRVLCDFKLLKHFTIRLKFNSWPKPNQSKTLNNTQMVQNIWNNFIQHTKGLIITQSADI